MSSENVYTGTDGLPSADKKVITVSANSLNLSACMRKYDYAKLRRRQTIETAPSLDKGDLVHHMLEAYYTGKIKQRELGLSHADLIDLAIQKGRKRATESDLNIPDAEQCVQTVKQYCIFYKEDPWVPVAVESPFSYILYEDDEIRIVFEGKIDLTCTNPIQGNMRLVIDHKTGSRNSVPSGLSNQFMGYCVVSGTKLAILNRIGFQKTLPPEKKFVRHIIPYPQRVLDEWRSWTIWRARLIAACIEEEHFYPDFTKCDEYSGCQFKDVCLAPPETRDDMLMRFFKRSKDHDLFKNEDEG